MSISDDVTRERRKTQFAQYVKDQKEAVDRNWAEETERVRQLNEAERKHNEQVEAEMKIAKKIKGPPI